MAALCVKPVNPFLTSSEMSRASRWESHARRTRPEIQKPEVPIWYRTISEQAAMVRKVHQAFKKSENDPRLFLQNLVQESRKYKHLPIVFETFYKALDLFLEKNSEWRDSFKNQEVGRWVLDNFLLNQLILEIDPQSLNEEPACISKIIFLFVKQKYNETKGYNLFNWLSSILENISSYHSGHQVMFLDAIYWTIDDLLKDHPYCIHNILEAFNVLKVNFPEFQKEFGQISCLVIEKFPKYLREDVLELYEEAKNIDHFVDQLEASHGLFLKNQFMYYQNVLTYIFLRHEDQEKDECISILDYLAEKSDGEIKEFYVQLWRKVFTQQIGITA